MRLHACMRTRFIISRDGTEESRHVTLFDAFEALRALPSPRLPRAVYCVVIHRDRTEEVLRDADLARLAFPLEEEPAAAE